MRVKQLEEDKLQLEEEKLQLEATNEDQEALYKAICATLADARAEVSKLKEEKTVLETQLANVQELNLTLINSNNKLQ